MPNTHSKLSNIHIKQYKALIRTLNNMKQLNKEHKQTILNTINHNYIIRNYLTHKDLLYKPIPIKNYIKLKQ